MHIKIDEEDFTAAVAQDLLVHAEHAENAKDRRACLRAAMYYMTYEDSVMYLGSEEAAKEYWGEF